MKSKRCQIAMLLVVLFCFGRADAEDMRDQNVRARQEKKVLLEKAEAEKAAAEKAALAARERIQGDRSELQKAVAELKARNAKLTHSVQALEGQQKTLLEKEKQLTDQSLEKDAMVRELVGVIRINAKDIDALIDQNLQSALTPPRNEFLKAISGQSLFPAMEDIRAMAAVLWDEIQASGEVRVQRGTMVDRTGTSVEAQILSIGNFTAAYRAGDEVGYLNYSSAGQKLFALSRLPDSRIQKQLVRYMDGQNEEVPLDVSRGGALRQITQHITFWQRVPQGGPIGWIIVALFGVGVLIVLERFLFFHRRRFDGHSLLNRIDTLSAGQNWEGCKQACAPHTGKPLARVMLAGLNAGRVQREELENVLQEAILREIPPLEHLLSTLGMLATIAPLLGLLGTVTGMINTFHVITQHGAADPRLMSSGISEALVTTMLGLIAAIPFLFVHTLLNRKADTTITEMEEKAVALVNILQQHATTE
ncbi:MAG: MotA/TolQ/ExbB proton channel family protein [Pseudomonadota bacterium]